MPSQVTPDWRSLRRLGSNWRRVEERCSPLPVPSAGHPAPSPYVHPFPPKVTQSTQESAEGRDQKHKTQRNPRCGFCYSQIPSTTYQVPVNRYPSASLSLSHARTSSPAEDMSFATLCLTLVHVFGTWLGQLTETPRNQHSRVPDELNHAPNSARMNGLIPSRPVSRQQSLLLSIRIAISKNGQHACSSGVTSASAL